MHLKIQSNYSKLMILVGLLVATPLLSILFFKDEIIYAKYFLISSFISVFFGLLFEIFNYRKNKNKEIINGSFLVLFIWIWGSIIGALPFVLSGELKIIQSIFESVSGWTTTGLSVMDVSKTPKIFLFYRSFMQFCGGLGFIMMMLMVVYNRSSNPLFSAEGHTDKLKSNLRKTTQTVCGMYTVFLICGVILYKIVGMDIFDGICHAMSALSTGGFSTKLNSIGEYNSFPIEIITYILMIIGTINFATMNLIVNKKFKETFKVSELRATFVLLFVFIGLITFSLTKQMNLPFFTALRKSFLDVISAVSTTGYSSGSYTDWPQFSIALLIIMMLIGGGMGSTAGGIKISRIYIAFRIMLLNIKKKLSPSNKVYNPYYYKAQGKEYINNDIINDTSGFIFIYLLIFFIGSLMITITAGVDFTKAMFEFSSSIGTVGLSIGITNTTTNNSTLIVEIFGMLLGRLEIFLIFTGISDGIKQLKNLKIC